MASSSGKMEVSENHTISEEVEVGRSPDTSLGLNVGPAFPTKVFMEETRVQLVTPKVGSTIEISLNPRLSDLKRQGVGNIDESQETSRELPQRRTREEAENDRKDIHVEHKKESQSHETQNLNSTTLLETIENDSQRNVEAPGPSSNHAESVSNCRSTLQRKTSISKTCESNMEELNVVACGLEYIGGVHDNMSQMQVQSHQCDDGGFQQGPELPLDKGLGANLVVTPGVVGEGTTTCTLEANHMDHVERSTNSGSQGTRKHRRRNLIQVLSDEESEDNVASTPTKRSLIFKTSYEYVAASNPTPLENDFQLQELYSSSSTGEASRMAGVVVGMEFGGGISVTEAVTEELETNGMVIPKYPLNGQRRKKTVELLDSGNADVSNDHVEVGLVRKRLRRLSSSTSVNDDPRISYTRLRCGGEENAAKLEHPSGSLEVEAEVECSDKDTNSFISDSSSTGEASRMAGVVVGMEFGGGISVTEAVTEELETNGMVVPKYPLNGQRKRKVELLDSGNADVSNDHVEVGLVRRKRLRRLSSSTPVNDDPRISYTRLRCGGEENAAKLEHPSGSLEVEAEVECSDKDTNSFIRGSSEASSESSGSGRQFVETYESSKPRANITTDASLIDKVTNSDSDSDILVRRMVRSKRKKHAIFETEPQTSESSKSPRRSSSHEISSPSTTGQVENLLELSSEDLDSDDVEMDNSVDSLRNFIVSVSEDSVSNGEEDISDSDSGEGDNGNQETFREEIVRKRHNLIWDFEGDMLAAMQNNIEVALQAVCALYRQQTEDEQRAKGALYSNGRGFNKANALRGSKYAEFLIDGDEFGQLKKSGMALESQFQGATKDCQSIAAHHSKQLFEIYSNLEDQFWRKPTGENPK